MQAIDADESAYHRLIRRAVELARQEAETEDRLERGRLRRQIDSETRHATGVAKAPAIVHFVRGLIEAGEAVLVFAWHHEVIDIIGGGLNAAAYLGLERAKPVRLTGRESEAEKAAARDAFIAGDSSVCILNLRSAAGIDGLQARNPSSSSPSSTGRRRCTRNARTAPTATA